jgi:exodeoxyribonuclease VIII
MGLAPEAGQSTRLTMEEYRARPGVNFSTLKFMRRSPAHYKWAIDHRFDGTPRMDVGSGAHTCVLEPDRFPLEYAVFPGPRRAGKAWDEFAAAHEGHTILKASEYDMCLGMRDAVRSHPVAGPLLEAGQPEVCLFWTDEQTGIECKARLDWLTTVLVDLKTTSNVDRRIFSMTSARMGYHAQLAWYRTGLRANGVDVDRVKIVAVEASAPHDVAVFDLSDDVLFAGEQECAELLAKVSAGRFSGQWPGRYPEEQALELPAWAWGDESDAGGLGINFGEEITP